MWGSSSWQSRLRVGLLAIGALMAVGLTGCLVDIGGQMHPSPYYLTDDVQYFPPGPEFKLAREAAAQKQFAGDQALQR